MKIQTTPKPVNYTLLWIAAILCGIIAGMFLGPMLVEYKTVKVDLPEEYQIIKPTDILKGTYDSLSNTLVIEFNNIQNR